MTQVIASPIVEIVAPIHIGPKPGVHQPEVAPHGPTMRAHPPGAVMNAMAPRRDEHGLRRFASCQIRFEFRASAVHPDL